ncbi:MAG TPA: hypothetical protein VJ826_13320 [Candidatus Polarisedimenticolaceae bacterium]|nr:hypothetical protein [Candidatus Polarisedimenticolaceae bacterium]
MDQMRSRKVTLEESIAALADETGATPAFVEKVRALFLGRGIDLEDSSEPYTAALVEAFRRHAAMRHRLDDARGSLVRLHSSIAELGEVFSNHLARLRALKDALEKRERALGGTSSVTVKIEALRMVPGERDRSIVPGPDDPQ